MTSASAETDREQGDGTALVGPIMQAGEMADLVFEAISLDNPDVEVLVRDEGSYIRVHTPGRCRLTGATLSELAGRPLRVGDIEPYMAFFAGHITTASDEIVWHTKQAAGQPGSQK
jgi:toluene monooxygenase system protein D